MADETESTFPTTLDVFPRPTQYDNAGTAGVKLHALLNRLADAVEKLETLSTESVQHGSGAPTTAPTNPDNTAFYMDEDADEEYYWNVANQEWRRLL